MKWVTMLLALVLALAAASGAASQAQVPTDLAMLRVVHGAANAPPVDVSVDGVRAFTDVPYRGITAYQTISAGSHSFRVVQSGTELPVLAQGTVDLQVNSYNTVAAAGDVNSLTVLPTVDNNCLPANRIADVRIVNLSPSGPLEAALRGSVGVGRAPSEVVYTAIDSTSESAYKNAAAGSYNIDLREPGTGRVVAQIPNVSLVGATTYTVYAVGLLDGQPPLQGLLTADAPPAGR